MSMYDTAARIKAKYANMPPPDDWPLIGDEVDFTDRYNGHKYSGEVVEIVRPFDHWRVKVWRDVTKGENSDGQTILHVQQLEITNIIRRPERRGEA